MFGVSTPTPFTHTLTVTWLVDGQQQANGSMFTLNSGSLAIGNHGIVASINDATVLAVGAAPNQVALSPRSSTFRG